MYSIITMVREYGLPGGVKCYNMAFESITENMISIFDTYKRKNCSQGLM